MLFKCIIVKKICRGSLPKKRRAYKPINSRWPRNEIMFKDYQRVCTSVAHFIFVLLFLSKIKGQHVK